MTRSGPTSVEVSIRYERFPATVKGAFVLRGADGNPHTVQFEEAVISRIPEGNATPVPMGEVLVDVAPARDLFVPFEAPLSDLEPGWYAVGCRIEVDGTGRWTFHGRPFSMAWPRGEVRRGMLRLHRRVRMGGRAVHLDRVELMADAAVVVWRVEGQAEEAPLQLELAADGGTMEPLPPDSPPARLRGSVGPDRRSAFYPVPRSAAFLDLTARSGDEERRVTARLD
jgi:hypothetical protein